MTTESGDKREKVSMNQIEREIRNAREPVTARELSSQLPITNTQVNRKLRKLADKGRIKRKKVGSAAVVYWHPECF